MGKRSLTATEHEEQVALFHWAALSEGQYPELRLLYAIPNGGLRNIVVAKKLKAEGVKPGVPDICLPVARHGYHGLYMELKVKGGEVSKQQERWRDNLHDEGYFAAVVFGWETARGVLTSYLEGNKRTLT